MALERVNYYTGQRLDADDLRAEQRYQARIRELLNQGLFTPGVVAGLAVEQLVESGVPAPRTVVVSPGTALDARGRLVVVEDETRVEVPNQLPAAGAPAFYLVLRFAEVPVPGRADDCAPPGSAPVHRIREGQALDWSEVIPFPRPGVTYPSDSIELGIVLALVELDQNCTISAVAADVRRTSFPRNVSRVQVVAFHGEKDIVTGDPKKLYFHVRGGRPSAVVLYLRGDRFSPSAYTEIAAHSHTVPDATVGPTAVAMQDHQHGLSQHTHTITEQVPNPQAGTHGHALWMQALTTENHPERVIVTNRGASVDYTRHGYSKDSDDNPASFEDYVAPDGGHTHALTASTEPASTTGGLQPAPAPVSHIHTLPAAVDPLGSTGYSLRGGAAHTYLAGVRVLLDSTDITERLLTALPNDWNGSIGGDQGHPFNVAGTGPLDLVQLGFALGPGEHLLEFATADPAAGASAVGGKLVYNLYVE